MSLPISRKAEKAFAVGYLPTALGIVGLHIYEGHEKVERVELPNLIVYSEGSSPFPDMPVASGVRIVRIRCKFQIDSMVTTRADVDAWKLLLESVMTDDLAALQAILNKPVGTDNRAVKAIHFHYVEMADDPSDVSETDWIEDLVFNVTCELLDA
jgi:hypothetical protein